MRVLPIAGLLLLAGCRSILGIEDERVPPGVACASSEECPAAAPACLLPEGTCVQCTPDEAAGCTGATPACDVATHTCAACRAHADCASRVCLPDGSCAAEAEIAYVSGAASTVASSCTLAEPCRQLSTALGLAPPRPYVKVLPGTVVENGSMALPGRVVTIVGEPDAVLTRSGGGDFLRIEDPNARVTLVDVTLSHVMSTGSSAIVLKQGELTLLRADVSNNQGVGVDVQGGTIRISRSRFARNAGGGLAIDNLARGFEVVGNVFLENGTPSSGSGGVQLKSAQASPKRVELNSFSGNLTGGGGAAIHCEDASLTVHSNIVSGVPGSSTAQQVSGNCGHAYSIFFWLPPGNVPPGPTNRHADPLFRDPGAGDLHLEPGSPAQGAADPAAVLDALSELDLDGDRRTSPADAGADEAP